MKCGVPPARSGSTMRVSVRPARLAGSSATERTSPSGLRRKTWTLATNPRPVTAGPTR